MFRFAESIAICFYCKTVIIKSRIFLCVACGWQPRRSFPEAPPFDPVLLPYKPLWLKGFFHPYTLHVEHVKVDKAPRVLTFQLCERRKLLEVSFRRKVLRH